jgi:putative membrane protein
MMIHGYRFGYYMMGLHWAWFIVWILLVAFLIWALVRLYSRGVTQKPEATPLDVLRRRYAAGEISTQEFNERQATLQQSVLNHR